MSKDKPTIFIITGKTGSGKTTFLDQLVKNLQKNHVSISGFLAKRSKLEENKQLYALYFLDSCKLIPFASREPLEEWTNLANFYFNPEAILCGQKLLHSPEIFKNDLIVIDEIGIFELEGKVWADSISFLVNKSQNKMIWVVRNTLIEKVIRKWDIRNPVIFNIEKTSVSQAAARILSEF